MERLLIAFDGSRAAEAAIGDLAHAALPAQLEATIIAVADVYLPPEEQAEPRSEEIPPLLIRQAREKALREISRHEELAIRACERVRGMFPKWTCKAVAVGDSPGWAVVKHATDTKADLVVAGAQSHSRLERFFLGSVSHKVMAEAPCSVRIGRHDAATDGSHVMVAVDGSPSSLATLREITTRPWEPRTQFRIVTVVDPHLETAMVQPGLIPADFVKSGDRSGRDWINRMTEAASRILVDAGLSVSNFVYDGNPKEVLLRASGEWPAHCIFMGAQGLHHGGHLSLGTVASAVASRAPCSVEIVRRALK